MEWYEAHRDTVVITGLLIIFVMGVLTSLLLPLNAFQHMLIWGVIIAVSAYSLVSHVCGLFAEAE